MGQNQLPPRNQRFFYLQKSSSKRSITIKRTGGKQAVYLWSFPALRRVNRLGTALRMSLTLQLKIKKATFQKVAFRIIINSIFTSRSYNLNTF
jgi:hypothetical protein